MTDLPRIEYFLGANSPTGFYSLYDRLIAPEAANAIYILKGGPGCGKSTLMRRVAARIEDEGLAVEYILCSGDPDSLDAILIPEKGAAIADGTSPHVIEPKYPGVVEQYVNMGMCYDKQTLLPRRAAVMECMNGYKEEYRRAYRCLDASARVFEDIRATLLTDELSVKLAKRAAGIAARELPKKKSAAPGQVKQRFLSAVSHRGSLCLHHTAAAQCSRIYELTDHCGLAHEFLIHLLSTAVTRGYNAVACPDPMATDRLAHLLIPEADVAFLSAGNRLPLPFKPYRHIRLDAATDQELLRRCRPRLHFAHKVSEALLEEAVGALARAKSMHDELESLYNPCVDFQLVESMARSIADEILSL